MKKARRNELFVGELNALVIDPETGIVQTILAHGACLRRIDADRLATHTCCHVDLLAEQTTTEQCVQGLATLLHIAGRVAIGSPVPKK